MNRLNPFSRVLRDLNAKQTAAKRLPIKERRALRKNSRASIDASLKNVVDNVAALRDEYRVNLKETRLTK